MQVAVGALQPSKAVHDGRNIDDAGGGCSYQLWLKQPRQSKRAQVICLRHKRTMLAIIGSVTLFLPSTIMINASFGSPAVCITSGSCWTHTSSGSSGQGKRAKVVSLRSYHNAQAIAVYKRRYKRTGKACLYVKLTRETQTTESARSQSLF